MTIDAALFARLSADAGLAALVGTRIYPVTLPAGATLPAVVYRQISGPRQPPFGQSTGPVEARFQLDALALGADLARQVCDALIAALVGFSGGAGVSVSGWWIENEMPSLDPEPVVNHHILEVMLLYE